MKPNEARLAYLRHTLEKLYQNGDDEDNLTDILADLLHYADWIGTDFSRMLDRAREHFYEERNEIV